jgi:hypothetical protein
MERKEIPFTGKLITDDAAVIGENFQTLTNMRYTDTHIEGVQGMTKINSSVMNATYLKTRSAFHFKKSQPTESHVLVQAANSGETASQILENTTAIPSTGNFSGTALYTDDTSGGTGRFSNGPDGKMLYANGVDTCIWGGDEARCDAFITDSAAVTGSTMTDPLDYTDVIINIKSDAKNVAVVGGGLDSYTKLLMHFNAADTVQVSPFIDDAVGTHTPSAGGNAQANVDYKKFGISSGYFDGTGDYITVPDHADWEMADGATTIDCWVRFDVLPTTGNSTGLWQQYLNADNSVSLKLSNSGGTYTLSFIIEEATVDEVTVSETWTTPVIKTWYHIALIRGWGGNANDWAITVDGTILGTATTTAYTWPDLAAAFEIGRYATGSYLNGRVDELRVSKGVARWAANFTPSERPYATSARVFLVGSTVPLKGMKATIGDENTVASTLTGKEWNGNVWSAITLTDNTASGGISLAQTGTITWSSTVNTAKPIYIEGYFLYFYQFTLSDGEATISHLTLDAPFQPLVDIWDGIFRSVTRFFVYVTNRNDRTTNVLEDDYDVDVTYTYTDLSSLAAFSDPNNCLEVGFAEPITGINFDIPAEYTNSTGSTVVAVDYWDGYSFTSVGVVVDGTSVGGISFAQTGVISWNGNGYNNESKRVISNSPNLYYYRIRFDQAMDAAVRLNHVTGITRQTPVDYFKFPVFAQGRILLCADMSGEKNKATVSGKYTPQVYNGTDSADIYFGEEGELTCGTELFSQYGSSLYSLILMFKDNETWVMAGQDINEWENSIFLLSNTIGCPAPLTLKTINLHAEPGAGINRSLAIWQGANGIYMSDGRAPIPIHGDIKEYFDRTDSRAIKLSKLGDSIGFIDPVKQEYHWLFASGTGATTLNKELVYDIARNKWFEIERSSDLQCGALVHDTDGNAYNYGFLDTGYMERLENGTDSDGTAITHTVQTGDMAFEGLAVETQVDAVRLITVAKTTTSNSVTLTHYSDGSSSGTAHTMSPARSGYRLAQPIFDDHLPADPFHSFKLTMITDDETIGFEPLALVATYHPTHKD